MSVKSFPEGAGTPAGPSTRPLPPDPSPFCGPQENAATLRKLLDALSDLAVLIDPQRSVLAANEAMARTLGKNLDEIVGRPLEDLDPLPAAAARGAYFDQVFRTGVPVRFEEEREGIVFDNIAHPVFDTRGAVSNVALLARDITQRKRMERALKESEATTRSLLKAAPIGIGIVRDRVFLWVSGRMCEMLGYTSGELIGKSTRLLYETEEEFLRVGELKYGAMTRQGFGEVETRWRCRDGTGIDVLLRSAPVHPEHPEEGVTFTALDISDRKRMEEEILKVQRLDSMAVLAGGIAHDFNNLLTAILSCVSVLRRNERLEAHEKNLLVQAETASLRARNLVQQILTFAKGGAPIRTTFSMEKLLRETAEFALSGSRTRCDYEIPADLRPVFADEGQTRQVLHNLILNADQSMPEGGRIRVRAQNVTLSEDAALKRKGGEFVRVSIQDQGCGIPERERSRIYDPFFTTKEKGRGLGLSTAFTIVSRHEGRIQETSEVGVGSTFHVYFPASTEPLPRPRVSRIPRSRGQGRILIVDDEAIIRESAEAILTRLGFEVAQARDGAEGIRKYEEAMAEKKPFDAVIMDLTIPGGMGGQKAVGELKRIDPAARVIVSSGYSQDPVMSRFRDYGFSGVLPKPYKIVELEGVLARVLSGAKE
jgi:two-component system, cell cycle sensor histidine kinase and response regulator CckA